MGLHVKKLWPISGFSKKPRGEIVPGGEPQSPSKIKKGWRKLFHKLRKGDNSLEDNQLIDEVASPSPGQEQIEVEELEIASAGIDEPLRRPSDHIDASHANEDVITNAEITESPALIDNFAFRDWSDFVEFVVASNDLPEHGPESNAQVSEQILHGYQALANQGIDHSSQHTREVSDSTLLNSIPTPSRTHLLPEGNFQRTDISLIEEEASSQISSHGEGPSKAGDLATASQTQKKNETRAADRRSIESGNDNAAWEKAIEMIEKRHENDVADLKEEHALEVEERDKTIQRLEGQLKRAEKKNDRMRMRVNGLLEGHSALKTEVEAAKEALQDVISASQVRQAQYDELQQKYESLITGPGHDDPVEGGSIPPIEPETEAATDGCEYLPEDLDQLRHAFRNMASDLFKALEENRNRWGEVYQLRRALEQDPAHDIGLQQVVEYKDQKIHELETTASECSVALDKLERESSKDMHLAREEISRLRDQIAEKSSAVSVLRTSRAKFQDVAEDILDMLKGKVYPNDLIQAMEGYYQTAISDNKTLASGSKKLADQIDEMHETITTLRGEVLEAKRSSEEKDALCEQLTQEMREKENEVGSLEVKLEALQHDYDQLGQEKSQTIADLERGVENVSEKVDQLLDATLDERNRVYVQLKEHETSLADARSQELFAENETLRRQLQDLQQQDELGMCLGYFTDIKQEQMAARLKEAEEELETLRAEIHLLRKLPPEINITQVLEEREELVMLRKRLDE